MLYLTYSHIPMHWHVLNPTRMPTLFHMTLNNGKVLNPLWNEIDC